MNVRRTTTSVLQADGSTRVTEAETSVNAAGETVTSTREYVQPSEPKPAPKSVPNESDDGFDLDGTPEIPPLESALVKTALDAIDLVQRATAFTRKAERVVKAIVGASK